MRRVLVLGMLIVFRILFFNFFSVEKDFFIEFCFFELILVFGTLELLLLKFIEVWFFVRLVIGLVDFCCLFVECFLLIFESGMFV